MLSTILTKTKTILDTVSSSILPLKYSFLETMPSSFPAAALTYQSHATKRKDTVTNMTEARFLLRVVFPTEERAEAQLKWLTLLDALDAELRKDDHETLTGSVVSFLVTNGESAITLDYGQPVVIFTMVISAQYLSYINT